MNTTINTKTLLAVVTASMMSHVAIAQQLTLEHEPLDIDTPKHAIEQAMPILGDLVYEFGVLREGMEELEIQARACQRNGNSHRQRSGCIQDLLRRKQTDIANLRANEVAPFYQTAHGVREEVDRVAADLRSHQREVDAQIQEHESTLDSVTKRAQAMVIEIESANGEMKLTRDARSEIQTLMMEAQSSESRLGTFNQVRDMLRGHQESMGHAMALADELVNMAHTVDYQLELSQGKFNDLEWSVSMQADAIEVIDGIQALSNAMPSLKELSNGLTNTWADIGAVLFGNSHPAVSFRFDGQDDEALISWLRQFNQSESVASARN